MFKGISAWTLAQQQAQVPIRHVNAKQGLSANFSCESSGSPITYCLWERQQDPTKNQPKIYIEFAARTHPGQQGKKPGYFLSGEGLDKGQCGLKINRVEDQDNGIWQCTLLAGSESQRGEVHVSILRKSKLLKKQYHFDYMHVIIKYIHEYFYFICRKTNCTSICCEFGSYGRRHQVNST